MAHKNKTNYSPYKARQQKRASTTSGSSQTSSENSTEQLKGFHKKPEKIFSVHEANDRLYDIFKNHEFDLVSHKERMELSKFYEILMKNQEHQNFTRLLKIRDIAIKHYIDSIIITKYTKLQFPLMDVGTGPGFPGIPLKIMYPNEKILLAEGVQKRVQFLKDVRSELDLKNLDIIGRNINKYFMYPVKGVITRAVEDVTNTLTNVQNCLEIGGRVYFMKGPGVNPEIEMFNSHSSLKNHYKLIEDIKYNLPHTEHQRRLVIFEKTKHFELPPEDPEENLLLEELSGEEKRKWSSYT